MKGLYTNHNSKRHSNLILNFFLYFYIIPHKMDSARKVLCNPLGYILLRRNSEKPHGLPFSLTPFAITLNDCPKLTLKVYICSTHCRLRPDQGAFEMGKYELANGLKQEHEKQRVIRRAREEGKVAPLRPRWFVAETDGDVESFEGSGGWEFGVLEGEGEGDGQWGCALEGCGCCAASD